MLTLTRMLRRGLPLLMAGALGMTTVAHASVEEVLDDDLSQVTGEDGVSIMLHLEWNANALTSIDLNSSSSVSVGFERYTYGAPDTDKVITSLVFQGFGGIVDLWSLHIDARSGPADVGDYVDITLPNLVSFKDFGFRALYAQSGTAEPTASYGKWLWNGSATATGNVYIWPAK